MAPNSVNLGLLRARQLALIGAGNMAEALVRGVLNAQAIPPEQIIASDPTPERRGFFEAQLGVKVSQDNCLAVKAADLVVLSVKPQQIQAVSQQIAPVIDVRRHTLASICAGISTARLENNLPQGTRVVRVMPNTPMLVGLGASCLCGGKHATANDLALVEALFGLASLTMRVDEPLMDAVTGLSGSGPAYLFYLVEAMVEAGVAEGFTRPQASALAARTVLGAAQMLEQTGLAPELLRQRVTSPNGTTQAAIEQLDAGEVKAKIAAAVRRAAERSRELGRA